MLTKYTTNQGDTFDSIAKQFYDSERYFIEIINANGKYADTIIFSSGIELIIPELSTVVEDTSATAPWR